MAESEQEHWFIQEVHPHESQLRAYLQTKFPTLEDVDDIIQESYARLLTARQKKVIEEPKAFLFATARNAVFDLFRRKKVVQFESLTHFMESSVIDNENYVEDTVSLRDEINLLVQAVESLPKRCRQVMTLRMVYGYSQKEIARELGISAHTVKAQLAKGMRRSAEYISHHDDR